MELDEFKVVGTEPETYLNQTEVLERPYWNKRLLKKLLVEPDRIERKPDGRVHRYCFALSRVEEAEESGAFLAKKNSDEEYARATKERAKEILESLQKAIELDLAALTIPEKGTIEEVLDYCHKEMRSYNSMMRVVDLSAFRSVYSPHSDNGLVDPDIDLLVMIAEARPDLAFDAGRRYQLSIMNISYGGGTGMNYLLD